MEEKKAHSAGPSRAQLPSNPACPVRPGFGAPLGGATTGVAHPPLGALALAEQTIPSLLDGAAWNSEDRGERTDIQRTYIVHKLGFVCTLSPTGFSGFTRKEKDGSITKLPATADFKRRLWILHFTMGDSEDDCKRQAHQQADENDRRQQECYGLGRRENDLGRQQTH